MAEIKKMTLSGASPVIRGGHPEGAEPFVRKVKRGGEFLAEYTPITYTIDGVLPSGSLYGLTGKRGSAKTAFLQGMSLSVVTGRRDILGFDVDRAASPTSCWKTPTILGPNSPSTPMSTTSPTRT
jgi:hypothetical protein